MRLRLAIMAALLIAARGPASADGYRFDRSEFVRERVMITVVTYPTTAAFRAAARAAGVRPRVAAWAQFETERPTCTIHVIEPGESYRPEALGHEFLHCLRGRWHD